MLLTHLTSLREWKKMQGTRKIQVEDHKGAMIARELHSDSDEHCDIKETVSETDERAYTYQLTQRKTLILVFPYFILLTSIHPENLAPSGGITSIEIRIDRRSIRINIQIIRPTSPRYGPKSQTFAA